MKAKLVPMVVLAGMMLASFALAQSFDVQATIKKVDAEQGRLYFNAMQADREALVVKDAKILDAKGTALAGGLGSAELKPGAVVTLTIERSDNKPLIRAIKLGGNEAGKKAAAFEEFKADTTGLVPLTDLGNKEYKGFQGGLYPDGKNTRPKAHETAGLKFAKEIEPLDKAGKPNAAGKIVLLGIGFSNTVQAMTGFIQVAKDDKEINPKIVIVNGAYGGMAAYMVHKTDEGRGKIYWTSVDEKLKDAGVSRAQVQVIWLKETNPAGVHEGGFPKYTQELKAQIGDIMRILHDRFPNLKLAYLSSRTYGGWAKKREGTKAPGNSEPYSYESGFAVKWLIEEQIKGEPALNFDAGKGAVKAPWLSWGPYLWANGSEKRADGFFFEKSDFRADDQMHHSAAGITKMGRQLVDFFKTDATTRGWFVRPK